MENIIIPIEVSARHVHLTQEVVACLFDNAFDLQMERELNQPGEFVTTEKISLKGRDNRVIEGVRVLGPVRDYNQVEISQTDAYRLGIKPPIRDSSELNLSGTPGITLIGPQGECVLDKGVVIPWRHIHISPNQALDFGLSDGQIVKVDINNHPRSLVFENVIVRVSPKFTLAMHIDTDEGNAAGIDKVGEGVLIV